MVITTDFSAHNKKVLFVAPHPDDDVIGCGALLLYLSELPKDKAPQSIHIAYGVSGFNGVTDRYLKTILNKDIDKLPESDIKKLKSELRRNEAAACCNCLRATPHFLDLPFYESESKKLTESDLNKTINLIKKITPDIVVLINEGSDPHGTHGIVRSVFMDALKKVSFQGLLIGYRVWDEALTTDDCSFAVLFNEEDMLKKENIIRFYVSQIIDPAFPQEHFSFVEYAKILNKKSSKNSEFKYAECYSFII